MWSGRLGVERLFTEKKDRRADGFCLVPVGFCSVLLGSCYSNYDIIPTFATIIFRAVALI